MSKEKGRGLKFKILSRKEFFDALGITKESEPYDSIANAGLEFEPPHLLEGASRVVVSDKTIKYHLDKDELTQKSLASVICYIFQRFDDKDEIVECVTKLFNSIKKISGKDSHRESLNNLILENISIKAQQINNEAKFPSDLNIFINRNWNLDDNILQTRSFKNINSNPRQKGKSEESNIEEIREDVKLPWKFKWSYFLFFLFAFAPVIAVPFISIAFYKINFQFSNSPYKFYKNFGLGVILILNIGLTYLLWDNADFYSAKEVNIIINDTVQKTKMSFSPSAFNKNPSGLVNGILSFNLNDIPQNETSFKYIKAGDIWTVNLYCTLSNSGSFPIYNAKSEIEYDKSGTGNTVRINCILSGYCATASDSAYLVDLPSSWSLKLISAEIKVNTELRSPTCKGYKSNTRIPSTRIGDGTIRVGDLDTVRYFSNGKEYPCDVVVINYLFELTNTSS